MSLTAGAAPLSGPPDLVLWAWERPEYLVFAGPGVGIAVLAGTVTLSGSDARAVPRLQPAYVHPGQRVIGVVHIETDRTRPLPWNTAQRARVASLVLSLLDNPRFAEVQIDFEVRASQRDVLLDLVRDVRAALPPAQHLSMTALASWCDTETWLNNAAADEIVPMLFRMGPAGEPLRQRLASGGDFRLARCRSAVGIATDTPPLNLPPGRRLWLFNPSPWTPAALAAMRERLQA
ncbi:MAG: hypothetical protein ACJ8AI_23570 [Rhodopila sp.]